MWELGCEGHWGSHSVMQPASNRQLNKKARPARSSAAKGKKLWIMMGIIHKSCCHILVSESHGMSPHSLSHTHTHTHTHTHVHCLTLLIPNESPVDAFLALSAVGTQWHIFSNAAILKFMKRLNHCPGNGADTETNTNRNGYRHPKLTFLWRCIFYSVCVCVCVCVRVYLFCCISHKLNKSDAIARWSCINR